MMELSAAFLQSAIKRVSYYKALADKTFVQLDESHFHFKPNKENNSIAIIIQHVAGNMLSRWTDFLTTDGEKEWRNRDKEFEEQVLTKDELSLYWNKGWDCFLNSLQQLTGDDLMKTVHIRGEEILVVDAINRQLAHYPYHVGQIIYIAKIIMDKGFQNLSVPKGNSREYNEQQFNQNAR